MKNSVLVASCWLVCATAAAAARPVNDDQKAVGLCVAAYVAPKAISEKCAVGSADPSSCKEAEMTKWSAAPGGLAAYPDRAACGCAATAVRDRLHGKGVRYLLASPQDPFRADPNNDAGARDPGNRLKTAVLEIARTCKVPAF